MTTNIMLIILVIAVSSFFSGMFATMGTISKDIVVNNRLRTINRRKLPWIIEYSLDLFTLSMAIALLSLGVCLTTL